VRESFVSLNRYAKRTDLNQNDIVLGLRQCGVTVEVIGKPVDLLTYYRGNWLPLEIKNTKYRDKRQKAQKEFLESTGCPVVKTFEEALQAVVSKP
jgi:hypothetical protein